MTIKVHLLFILTLLVPCWTLSLRKSHARVQRKSKLWSSTSEALLEAIRNDDEPKIASCITELESYSPPSPYNENEKADFDPLIGLYEVSHVKTKLPKDNPVGGKWTRKGGIAQKFLRTRRSFQHILPVNATGLGGQQYGGLREVVGEAVNVVSLEALGGMLLFYVILRGDAVPLTLEERTNTSRVAQPLSPLAVKALFDPPRIVLGKKGRILNVNVGPKTSVLLDTLYCDDKVRLGMGGTSGSRLVFGRCADDDEEANEFRSLLVKPMQQRKFLAYLGGIAALGFVGVVQGRLRILSCILATLALSLGALIAFSGGGIDRGDMGVSMRKDDEATTQSVT